MGGWGFMVRLPKDFQYEARKLSINRRANEDHAREIIRLHGFDPEEYSHSFCNWEEGGLLHHLRVPGNAAGLALEINAGSPGYFPHNIDGLQQMSMCLSIITRYLGQVQYLFL